MASSRADTVAGVVTADDADGIDSVWVTVGAERHSADAGFNRTFRLPYRFVIPSGQPPGTHISLSVRARDVAAFQTQRDSYVVVVP